jgi:hypothetical protein
MGRGGLGTLMATGDPLTVGLLLAAGLGVALLASAFMPLRVGFWIGCATSTFQLYSVPLGSFYPSIAVLGWLSTWPVLLTTHGLWHWRWTQALLLLMAVQGISLLWSPDPVLGIRDIIYALPMLFAALGAYRLAREDPGFVFNGLVTLLVGSLVEAMVVIAFRLLPAVEIGFLHGALARVFISGNVLDLLFTPGGGNNVLDPDKAGGFFVNGNIASAFLGVCAVLAWYLATLRASVLLRVIACMDWLAVWFTGSKAGIALAALVPLGCLVAGMVRERRIRPSLIIGAAALACVGAVVVTLNIDALERFLHASLATLGTRSQVWHFASLMVREHPLLGLGFGGWEQRYPLFAYTYGLSVNLPPHNSLLILWAQSGLLAALAGAWWIASVGLVLLRGLALHQDGRLFAIAVTGAASWYVLEGFGENMGLDGEVHLAPLLGVLLGYLCALCESGEAVNERASQALRSAAAPSALPAL